MAVAVTYRLVARATEAHLLGPAVSDARLAILEKLNRADRGHLPQLALLVVPDVWADDELGYSQMPLTYSSGAALAKLLVLHVPGQMFGAYEFGFLVRWGPVSSGGRARETPQGLFHLNWRSQGRVSTVDPDWFMPWYFNFANDEGLSFHGYTLPGRPTSHGCVRLLERDARWLFGWGDEWTLDHDETRVLKPGTPVFVVGAYDFDAAPPWQSMEWLMHPVQLPPLPAVE
jgi:hypothetical protein